MNNVGIIFALLATLTAPVYPGGAEYDGLTSIISISNQAAINSTVFSFGCWTRAESLGESSAGRIMDHATGWSLRTTAGTPEGYRFLAVGWDTTDGQWDISVLTFDVWAHVAVTYDASSTANIPVMYYNGVSQAISPTSDITPVGTFTMGTGALTIGNIPAATRTWDGQLAECFYYDRILSAAEINQIAFRGPASRGVAIGYWPLGVFGARNYTRTAGLTGTPTAITVSTVAGPPLRYASQGEAP